MPRPSPRIHASTHPRCHADHVAATGDDRIQETAQGRVTPENFTHGSAEQRMHWFTLGYDEGAPTARDTLSVPQV
ncbi:neutral zinc metallopeptidase [Brevibacterium yomogidense]|uniref:neutral zinc metallopeptidase n=1 Tax=Brevibacterium yomogidense TaxID=946573 RepID=UPI0018DF397B